MTAPLKKHAALLEDVAIVGELVAIQFVYAGNSILLGYLMSWRWRRIDFVGSVMTFGNLVGFSIAAGATSGVCVSFNGWAMKKRGPVLVSMFSPIGTVWSVVVSVNYLRRQLSARKLRRDVLMFASLYFVLWAKGKENHGSREDKSESEFDQEKPLLS